MKKRIILLLVAATSASFLSYAFIPIKASPLQYKLALEVLHELSLSKIGSEREAMGLLQAREAITLERLGFGYQRPGNTWLRSRLPVFREAEIHYSDASSSLHISLPTMHPCISEGEFQTRFSNVIRNPVEIWSWHTPRSLRTFDGRLSIGGINRHVFAKFTNNCLSTFSLKDRI